MARSRKKRNVAEQVAEIAMLSPQIMFMRSFLIATGGLPPSAKVQKEVLSMTSEKVIFPSQAVLTFWLETAKSPYLLSFAMASDLYNICLNPKGRKKQKLMGHTISTTHTILQKSLHPIHHRVTSNADRLNRRRAA